MWKESEYEREREIKCFEMFEHERKLNKRLTQGEDEVLRIWKEYFEDLHNIDTQEHVALMGFGEATSSEENQLEELRLG